MWAGTGGDRGWSATARGSLGNGRTIHTPVKRVNHINPGVTGIQPALPTLTAEAGNIKNVTIDAGLVVLFDRHCLERHRAGRTRVGR